MTEDVEKQEEKKPAGGIIGNRWARLAFGLAAGAVAGGLYWHFIGCNGGSCPLTSNPTNTIVLFTIMGGWMSYK